MKTAFICKLDGKKWLNSLTCDTCGDNWCKGDDNHALHNKYDVYEHFINADQISFGEMLFSWKNGIFQSTSDIKVELEWNDFVSFIKPNRYIYLTYYDDNKFIFGNIFDSTTVKRI